MITKMELLNADVCALKCYKDNHAGARVRHELQRALSSLAEVSCRHSLCSASHELASSCNRREQTRYEYTSQVSDKRS